MKINGNVIARNFREQLQSQISNWKLLTGKVPGLAVVLVGNRPDSVTYVKFKEKAAKEIGMNFWLHSFPEDVSQTTVLDCVEKCNDDTSVNGIIVQLPLPKHISANIVCERVVGDKDVDGLKLINLAYLATELPIFRGEGFVACTPQGCLELIRSTGIEIKGKKATVVGRSHIVGMPMALLLNQENATVTICHSNTPRELLVSELKQSDIVVVAVGKPELIKGEWLKEGCIVIDVGINSVEDPTKASGHRLVGDVHYASASKVASAITPVPGGVGPMTIAMLLRNTVLGFEKNTVNKIQKD